MRTLSKHVKIAILLSILAGLLLVISCCPGGWEQATGILQGLATGLLSGMVLFFVTGIKKREDKELKKVCNIIHKLNLSLKAIADAYGDIYHQTYHGKKEQMNFESYLSIVRKTYDKYMEAYGLMSLIDVDLIPDIKIREYIKQYIEYLIKEIRSLELTINSVKDGDKDTLNEFRDKFYDIQHEAYQLRWDSMKYEDEIYKKIVQIDNSLL
jgi:hypothetical protein